MYRYLLVVLFLFLYSFNSFSAQWAENLTLKDGKVLFKSAASASSTPASGYGNLYMMPDNFLYFQDSSGVVKNLLLGGSTFLNDLTDVNTSGAVLGQVLGYDGSNWVPSTGGKTLIAGNGITIDQDSTTATISSTGKTLVAGNNVTITQDATTATISSSGKTLVGTSPITVTQDTTTATFSLGTIDYLDFNTAITPSALNGRLHYDQDDKTMSVDIDTANGVKLQIGQESYIRAVNKTGAPITDGTVVYISGAQGNRPTVVGALANTTLGNRTIGVATQNIADNAEGMITTQGIVGGFNTSGFTSGDRLYLSNSVAGGITNLLPSDPIIQIGWALNSTASGKILVDIKYISSTSQSIVGTANTFFFDATASFADNFTLSTTPSVYAEVANTKAVTSGTSPVFIERFVSGPLGRTSIPAGTWNFDLYAGTSNTTGLNEIKFRINKRVQQTGCTGTFTGAGTTRTFTTTGCSPFVAGDATGSILTATLIETPTQTAWVTAYTSSSVVTVQLTDPAFVNVSNTPLNGLYYHLFNTTTGDINSSSELKTVTSTQGAFTVNETDRIVIALFGSTDQAASRNITLYYGGTARYSHFDMPTSITHNELANIQGGTAGEYYHTTSNQNTAIATMTASGTVVRTTSDLGINISKYFYYGTENVDGSIRTYQSGGALITEKRVSGSWVEIARLDNL